MKLSINDFVKDLSKLQLESDIPKYLQFQLLSNTIINGIYVNTHKHYYWKKIPLDYGPIPELKQCLLDYLMSIESKQKYCHKCLSKFTSESDVIIVDAVKKISSTVCQKEQKIKIPKDQYSYQLLE